MSSISPCVAFILLMAALVAAQHKDHAPPESAALEKPIELVTTDAIAHRKVATSNKHAQAFFDQGLTLYYAVAATFLALVLAILLSLALIRAFEGFRGRAYRDAVGVWTIGFGHTSMAGAPRAGAARPRAIGN